MESYINTAVINLTRSRNLIIFRDLKIGLECSMNEAKVMMRIARFCRRNKGLTLTFWFSFCTLSSSLIYMFSFFLVQQHFLHSFWFFLYKVDCK